MLPKKNAQDITAPWTTWFLYGDTGSGKTSAAATFPRPYFIVPQNEQSIVTLKGRDIDYVEVIGSGTLEKRSVKPSGFGLEQIVTMIEQEYASQPDSFPYDTIVIESLSHYMDLVIEELTAGNKYDMDWSKWGLLSGHLRSIHGRLRTLDVNVVYTALANVPSDDGGKNNGPKQSLGPMMQGKMAFKLPSACDVVGYFEINAGKPPHYYAHFQPHRNYTARTRFPGIPAKVENFNYADIAQFL